MLISTLRPAINLSKELPRLGQFCSHLSLLPIGGMTQVVELSETGQLEMCSSARTPNSKAVCGAIDLSLVECSVHKCGLREE